MEFEIKFALKVLSNMIVKSTFTEWIVDFEYVLNRYLPVTIFLTYFSTYFLNSLGHSLR